MQGLPKGPGQRRESGFTVSRLREMGRNADCYLHCGLYCTKQSPRQDLTSFSQSEEVVRVDISLLHFTQGKTEAQRGSRSHPQPPG